MTERAVESAPQLLPLGLDKERERRVLLRRDGRLVRLLVGLTG